MIDCKAMTTPMASNIKLMSNSSSESVDATMYRQMIDVPHDYKTRYSLCCEHIDPVPDGSNTCSPDYCKAYSEVPEGYS